MCHGTWVKVRSHCCGADSLQLFFGFELRLPGLLSELSHPLSHLLDRLPEFFHGKCLLASLAVEAFEMV